MDYGGHSSSFSWNLAVNGKSCYGTGDFLNRELADDYSNNICIIDESDVTKEIAIGHLYQCSVDGMVPSNNTYYTNRGNGTLICGEDKMTLEGMQHEGYETGSTLDVAPDAETILSWAREILGLPEEEKRSYYDDNGIREEYDAIDRRR